MVCPCWFVSYRPIFSANHSHEWMQQPMSCRQVHRYRVYTCSSYEGMARRAEKWVAGACACDFFKCHVNVETVGWIVRNSKTTDGANCTANRPDTLHPSIGQHICSPPFIRCVFKRSKNNGKTRQACAHANAHIHHCTIVTNDCQHSNTGPVVRPSPNFDIACAPNDPSTTISSPSVPIASILSSCP